jgi:hypothetical protein
MAIVVDEKVKCMECRIGEPDGIGGFYCPEKNKEFHGDAAGAPRKCNYFQRRENDPDPDPDIAEWDEEAADIYDIPVEPKRKKTMAEIAAMGREALKKKREEMRKGIQEKVVEKRTKAGGNGKREVALKPVEASVEQAFAELKKSKKEQLQDMLGSFTVRELMQAGGVQLLLQVGAMIDTLEGKGRAA